MDNVDKVNKIEKGKIIIKLGQHALTGTVLLGISIPAFAAPQNSIDGVFEAAATSYEDSNDIKFEDESVSYTHINKNTRAKVSAHHYYIVDGSERDKYDGNEITAGLTQKYNHIETEVSVGAVYLDNHRTDKRKNHVKYKARVSAKPTGNATVSLEHSDDFLFKEAIITDDENQLLSGKTTKLSASWRVSRRVIAEGSVQRRKLSDGNASRHKRAALLYGISPDVPWVWAGAEVQSLSYDEKKNNYWSPTDYKSYALIANGNFPVSKKLSVNVSGSVNRTKEAGQTWASGYTAGVGADFSLNQNSHVKADAMYLKSTRDGVDWDGKRVGVSFAYSHY